jgi:cobalt-zinc-cadmium efflux system protein
MIMSIGLIISSLVIFFFGNPEGYMEDVKEWNAWHLFDPIATYIFSVTALASTLPIFKNTYLLLMESAPSNMKVNTIREEFENLDGVCRISHLHIWSLKPGKILLQANASVKEGFKRATLVGMTDIAREHKIFHTTFQVEEVEDP